MRLQEQRKVETDQKVAKTALRRDRRALLALALGLAAVLFALVGALGPAKHPRTSYSWPPSELPASTPEKLWYAPLLLTRQVPESLSVTLPCTPAPALPRADHPTLVLGTARPRAGADGLAVLRTRDRLEVLLGGETLTSVGLRAASTSACVYRLQLAAGSWSLTGGPSNARRAGSLDHMPLVAGLFSGLDLHAGQTPSVVMTTVVRTARTTIKQAILWTLAILAALTALALVALGRGRRPRPSGAKARPRILAHLGAPDLAVTLLLLVWWVVGPGFFDDGWVAARQQNFSASGGFSAYYTSFGVNLPLDYWLEWLEHWLAASSSALLVLRLPALLCLVATWILCRWILVRVAPRAATGAVRWALACAFAVAALAWGMTFRPEPVLALLVIAVFVCTLGFVERQGVASLAGAAVLAALAVSAHPAGIVALAPLLAVAPALARWTRGHAATAVTLGAGAVSIVIVFATVGSDLQQRRADVASLRAFGDETAGWRDELTRYTLLSQAPYGTPLRRASVALIVLAFLAYLFRRRRERAEPLLGLPARTLGFALLLLFLTPTKWPWHFGALLGLAATAVAAETARLRADASTSRGWDIQPFLVLGAAVAAAAWSWNPRTPWGDLDLRTLDWTLGFESSLTLSKLAGALPVLFLLGLALIEAARRGARRLPAVPWRAAAWTAPVLAVPVIAFTVVVLVDDAARTNGWTLARQNLDTLGGDVGCGLADDAVVPVRASMRAVPPLESRPAGATASWLPPAPANRLPRFALNPGERSPWFRLPSATRHTGFFLAGLPDTSESLQLEWARGSGSDLTPLGKTSVAGNVGTDARPDLNYWRFYAAGDLPAAPTGANAMRFSLQSNGRPGSAIGLTPPVTYEDESLATALQRSTPVLALPNLLLYVPCARQPKVADKAEVPRLLVAFRDSMWPVGTGTSPFDGLPSLYPLVRLPLSDSANPPGEVAIYEVDPHIDGAAVAPARAGATG
jgi:hypothetical protein